jgi:hypothetical protein
MNRRHINHYPHHVNVRLTKEQYDVVKANPTNVIRNLIDAYASKYKTTHKKPKRSVATNQ